MNRADKLLSVLADGRPHSRGDVFQQVGFMLTNNAASELRARGVEVLHWVEVIPRAGRVDMYRLGSLDESAGFPGSTDPSLPSSPALSSSEPAPLMPVSGNADGETAPGSQGRVGPLVSSSQLDLFGAAA